MHPMYILCIVRRYLGAGAQLCCMQQRVNGQRAVSANNAIVIWAQPRKAPDS